MIHYAQQIEQYHIASGVYACLFAVNVYGGVYQRQKNMIREYVTQLYVAESFLSMSQLQTKISELYSIEEHKTLEWYIYDFFNIKID